MTQVFEQIYSKDQGRLAAVADESRDVVVLSSGFDPECKTAPRPPRDLQLTRTSEKLLDEGVRVLRTGGWMFVYGLPEELPFWALRLSEITGRRQGEEADSAADKDQDNRLVTSAATVASRMVFKYWIALDLDDASPGKTLKPSHQGVLMFVKEPADKKGWPGPRLDIDAARLPHAYCAACGKTLKDWGGKKHLMNPLGAAISDVWRGLTRQALRDSVIPPDVLQRLALLTGATTQTGLHLIQTGRGVEVRNAKAAAGRSATLQIDAPESGEESEPNRSSALEFSKLAALETNHVYEGDCVTFLRRVKELQPRGAFDLAFADPPYNLEKSYSNYDDARAEQHYLDWCNAWLAGMADTLKPGGSLFVLNLPKWALHHATFLSARLEFRHWIVWDALSDPRGKIMPAHYALLWFTKPGAKPACHYAPVGSRARPDSVQPPDSPKYCLRAACIRHRKALGQDEKVELTDVWWDVHRIKHKRDRDAHPCQLPEKLMERILKLATRPGDVVFDPFCGAGTTGIAAAKLGRKYLMTEVDARYVRITNEKLAAMHEHADMFGEFVVPRKSVTRKRGDVSKREIERYLQELAAKLQRVPTEADVMEDRPGLLREIDLNYRNRGAAFKRAKIALADAK